MCTIICCVFYVQPLFTMSVQQQSIQPFTEAEYEHLTKKFGDSAVCIIFRLVSVTVRIYTS